MDAPYAILPILTSKDKARKEMKPAELRKMPPIFWTEEMLK